MNMQEILFWIFSLSMLGSGLLVISHHNAVHSAFFLINLFLSMAGLFLLLEAFFLAVVQVLVYAGAVMVLFLFVIMLLDMAPDHERQFPRVAVIGSTALGVILALEFYVLLRGRPELALPSGRPMQGGLKDVVRPLFTDHLLAVEVTGLVLVSAMIGVVLLTKREARP